MKFCFVFLIEWPSTKLRRICHLNVVLFAGWSVSFRFSIISLFECCHSIADVINFGRVNSYRFKIHFDRVPAGRTENTHTYTQTCRFWCCWRPNSFGLSASHAAYFTLLVLLTLSLKGETFWGKFYSIMKHYNW